MGGTKGRSQRIAYCLSWVLDSLPGCRFFAWVRIGHIKRSAARWSDLVLTNMAVRLGATGGMFDVPLESSDVPQPVERPGCRSTSLGAGLFAWVRLGECSMFQK